MLRSGGNRQLLLAADGRHVDGAAEHGRRERDRNLAIEVVAVAFEQFAFSDMHFHIQIARRPAAAARLAFAGQTDALPVVDTGGNTELQLLATLDFARAAAVRAGLVDDFARALALRAGLHHVEEAL